MLKALRFIHDMGFRESLPRAALLAPATDARALWTEAPVLAADSFDHGMRPELRFDVVLGSEARDAIPVDLATWLSRVLASCRVAVLCMTGTQQDALQHAPEFGPIRERTLAQSTSPGLVLLRGDLTFPLIRIDDYPTGVRPIPGDMGPLHEVLMLFEARSIPYWLGIVPGILTEAMFDFLSGLSHMIPVQHGYDHSYPKMSARLIARGDPLNQRGTVGTFNEFRWDFYPAILDKLGRGKDVLEQRLRRKVRAYIPPCNMCDRATAKALRNLGFELCLSDKPVPGDHLPVLRSDFYGRSSDAQLTKGAEVMCLHATWEVDVQRGTGQSALPAFLDALVLQTQRKQQAIDALALGLGRLQ